MKSTILKYKKQNEGVGKRLRDQLIIDYSSPSGICGSEDTQEATK